MRFAAGLSNRVNKYTYFPDPTNTPESVLDSPGAFFPVGEAVGKTEVSEIYGELLVPLLADKTGFQSLNLELGYRTTDNDPSPDDDTYKALIDWTIVERVRFRGGRQIANRAPNIGELFQASEQFAPFTFVQGDPCSTRDPAQLPYTANAAINGTARANQVDSALLAAHGAGGSGGLSTASPSEPAQHAADREDLESAGQSESALGAGGDDHGGVRLRPHRPIDVCRSTTGGSRSPT